MAAFGSAQCSSGIRDETATRLGARRIISKFWRRPPFFAKHEEDVFCLPAQVFRVD